MKNKALALLMAFSELHIGQEPTPQTAVRPVCDFTQEDRTTPPPKPKPTPMGKKNATVEPTGTPPTEINFEPPEPRGGTAIPTPEETPRDNRIPSPTEPQTTTTITAAEPQMGDTRTVDGQKQIYIVGFGWVADYGGGGEGVVVDGDGDIGKMVGIIGEEEKAVCPKAGHTLAEIMYQRVARFVPPFG